MAKKLNIKQVTLKKVTITPGDQTLTLRFPFTHRLADALGWFQELPEMTGTWSPDAPHNRVEVRTIEFRPTDETQVGRSFQLECHGHMENFTVIRKAAKGKDSKRAGLKKTDVICTVAFADENGAGMLTQYMRAVPASNIVVSYDPSPVQADLPGTEATKDPDQPTLDGIITDSIAQMETPQVSQDGIYVANPETTMGIEPEDPAETAQDEPEAAEPSDDAGEAKTNDPAQPVKRGRGRPRKVQP